MAEPDDPVESKPNDSGDGASPVPQPLEETASPKESIMEIHPIHGPVLTLREFCVHLTIITLGILIALSLEGLLEWRHHRSLVREARENLTLEISHNKKIVEKDLESIRKSEKQLEQIITAMQKLKKDRNLEVTTLTYGLSFESPHSTSWNTANRSGAVSFMSYDEVERYTEIYDQQQQLVPLAQQALMPLAQLSRINVAFSQGFKGISQQDLEEIERIANETLIIDQAIENGAQSLSEGYAKLSGASK